MSEQVPKPLVYVMTPVYNGEAYLRECIESVMAQTYSNWVYTIVSNCSTDRTLEIAEEYAARDRRIRIYKNRSFLRVIENHNLAFSLIPPKSKYCKPLMADDWLFPECLSEMVCVAEQNPFIGLVCANAPGYGRPAHTHTFDGTNVMRGRDICRATLLGGPQVFGTPTTQLIRADLIRKRQPFYNASNLHSDVEACFDILQESDFGFVHQVLTFIRVHETSITSQVEALESILVGELTMSVKFGPVYLTEQEQKETLECQFLHYYRALAKHFLGHREPQFWEFHRQKLGQLGYSLDKRKLTLAVLRTILDQLLWPYRVYRATQEIFGLIPPGNAFILVDENNWAVGEDIAARRRIPFLERDGQYWGSPADDATAIRELERLRQSGAGYIVFAWPAFWWLDYYTEFHGYLESEFRCILRNNNVVVFDLRGSDPVRT